MFTVSVFPTRSTGNALIPRGANSSEMRSVWGRQHGGRRQGEEGQSQYPNTLELEDAPPVMETLLALYRQDPHSQTHKSSVTPSWAPLLASRHRQPRTDRDTNQISWTKGENRALWGT